MPTIAETRSKLKTLFDESCAILQRHGGAITDAMPNEDRARLTENKAAILAEEVILDRLIADDADGAMFKKGRDDYGRPVSAPNHADGRGGGFALSIGAGVVGSDEYGAALKSGQLATAGWRLRVPLPPGLTLGAEAKRVGRESKALVTSGDTSGGAFVVTDRLAGYTPFARGELQFLDVLPSQSTTSDLVDWVEQTGRTNAAAPVAEATAATGTSGTKPESAIALQVVSKPVETIATILPVTTRILMNAPQLRAFIDDELLYMVREELEEQCMIGTGTTPQLLGMSNHTGIQTMAAGANPADALFTASMAVRFTGGVPATVAVVGPATLSALRLMRENAASGTQGGYLFGSPNQPGPMTVFGLEVVTAQATPATTAFVLNATATTIALIEREPPSISTGWINDDFGRNIVRVLAETQALLAIRRPKGIVKITGMP